MQNNREHIDDFLRDKMQDLQFDVNESHWVDAERRLDEDKEKKRPFWFFFVAVVLLVGAGLTALTQYQGNKKPTAADNIAVNTSATVSAPENADATTNDAEQSATDQSPASSYPSNQNTPTTADVQPNNTTVNKNDNAINAQSTKAQTPPTKAQGFASQSGAKVDPKATDDKTKNNNLNQLANKSATKSINKAVDNTQGSQTAVTSDNSQPVATAGPNTKSTTWENLSDAKKTMAAASANVKTVGKHEAINANPTNVGDSVAVQSNQLQNSLPTSLPEKQKNIRVYKSPEEYAKLNPRYVAGLASYEYNETVIPLNKTKSDSIRNIVAGQNAAATKPAEKKKKNRDPAIFIQEPSSFYIMAGLGGARGYKGNGTASQVWGLSPSLGVGYEQTFADRMSLYLTVYMSYINHLNIKESGTAVTYSFDRDSTLLSVTRKNLLQLHVPIQLSYKLRPSLSVVGGIGLNLGLNSISIYEDSKQSTQDKQFGYMSGLRFMDINANLGFDYAISPRISLGVFYQQGFLDMTRNTYFNNQHNDINARGGILMRYKFIK